MEAPKCRLCQKRHYGSCDARVAPGPSVVEPAKKIEAAPVRDVKLSENDSGMIVEGICPYCRTDLDAINRRLKYQRELMRKRRAKSALKETDK